MILENIQLSQQTLEWEKKNIYSFKEEGKKSSPALNSTRSWILNPDNSLQITLTLLGSQMQQKDSHKVWYNHLKHINKSTYLILIWTVTVTIISTGLIIISWFHLSKIC